MNATYLATVVSVQDPDNLNRVQVRLFSHDGTTNQDAPMWARVAVPFAGANRGAFLLPDVGDEVLVAFLNGDPRLPAVIGSFWNGAASAPDNLPGNAVDRWTLVGKNGTRIEIVEQSSAQERIRLTTPGGVKAEFTDAGGGKFELSMSGGATVVKGESAGITIQTSSKVTVQGSTVDVSAGMVKVDAGMSKFSGVVKCDTLITNSVVSSSYTPGAGNVW